MWLPHLADVAWMTQVLSRHAAALGLPGSVTAVQLLDARLTHPHRPESPRCRGWATYLVTLRDAAPVQLYVKGVPAGGRTMGSPVARTGTGDGREVPACGSRTSLTYPG